MNHALTAEDLYIEMKRMPMRVMLPNLHNATAQPMAKRAGDKLKEFG